MSRFVYPPLPTGSNRIRLLRLLPGSDEAEVRCEIFDYYLPNINASCPYEALSYVWGDASNRKQVFIGSENNCLDVTFSLFTALQRFRDRQLPRILWVDALCINQDDLQERAR